MEGQRTVWDIVKWKLAGSLTAAVILWIASGVLGFPRVFQWMFVVYAFLGFLVFFMLDAPSMRELTGKKAFIALVLFYLVVSGVYVAAASLLPQFDPEWEKGKIAKILAAKRAAHPASTRELTEQTQALASRTDELMQRLASLEREVLGTTAGPKTPEGGVKPPLPAGGGDLVARGKEVYELYECYNCHKIGGKGSTKKRGPKLDNIGNLLTTAQLKKKIFEPLSIYAEGFEKEHKKKIMPDNYPELMSEEELEALAIYLATLKDTSVETPKPIFTEGTPG